MKPYSLRSFVLPKTTKPYSLRSFVLPGTYLKIL